MSARALPGPRALQPRLPRSREIVRCPPACARNGRWGFGRLGASLVQRYRDCGPPREVFGAKFIEPSRRGHPPPTSEPAVAAETGLALSWQICRPTSRVATRARSPGAHPHAPCAGCPQPSPASFEPTLGSRRLREPQTRDRAQEVRKMERRTTSTPVPRQPPWRRWACSQLSAYGTLLSEKPPRAPA